MSDTSKLSNVRAMHGRACPDILRPKSKADYLRKLIDAGFRHIDAVSFVSPAAVPQMADSEQVLSQLVAACRCRDHRHRGEREGRVSGPCATEGVTTLDFLIPSRLSFFGATSIRHWKSRWMRCSEFNCWPTTKAAMWSHTSRWLSAIRTAMRGASMRCCRLAN